MTSHAPDNPSPGSPPGSPSGPPPGTPPGPRPHSKLAVAAIVLAVVPCCPPIPLAGSMLGLLAHTRIRRSNGWIRGERMAVIAMVLGSVLALVQMLVLEQFRESQLETQQSLAVAAVRTSLDRGTTDWPAGAVEAWATTASMDAAGLEAGVTELETELGSFVSLRLGDARAAGPGLAAGRVWSGFLSTGGGDRPAVIEAVVGQIPRAGAMGILPGTSVRLRAIRVMLRDGRELVIGRPFVVGEDAEPDASDAAGDSDTPEPTDPAGDSEQESG